MINKNNMEITFNYKPDNERMGLIISMGYKHNARERESAFRLEPGVTVEGVLMAIKHTIHQLNKDLASGDKTEVK